MSSSTAEISNSEWKLPSSRKVGMICLILTESSLFTIFVVAYIFYKGKSLNGPYPNEVLPFPIWGTLALFSSSLTVWLAEKDLHHGNKRGFHLWWAVTMALGAYFVYFTAEEWTHLIGHEGLTISTNVFGSTFYALVGLHVSHVIVGLVLLSIIMISSIRGKLDPGHHEHMEMVSWYWHFVDAIWVVVVSVVYIYSVHF